MPAVQARALPGKYTWTVVDRKGLPKRPADERVRDFGEIYSNFDEASVREQAGRCVLCGVASCAQACPLHNRIPEWMELAAEGDFLAAAAVSRSTSNMPEICSRVCPQERLCEGACVLGARSEPVSIGAVERFINEYAFAREAVPARTAPPTGFRVAVIGAGPGGLACADELAARGHLVTVYEALGIAGGLLAHGIPAFKLDRRVIARRVALLQAAGVVFRMGVRVGVDVSLADLRRDHHAIFLGVGAQLPKPLDVPGGDLPGVMQALPFLDEANADHGPAAPGGPTVPACVARGLRVVVVGGGDTAMDCLRTALRTGAVDALCVYRRDLANMPGSRKEYANALEEGARFQFLTAPVAVETGPDGRVSGLRCIRMKLGEPDAKGRRSPRPVEGSEHRIDADLVLVAYGFDPVRFPATSDLASVAVNDWGGFVVDGTQRSSQPDVFSGGDAVRGPSLVVHAVADGRRAAAAIHARLSAAPSATPSVGPA